MTSLTGNPNPMAGPTGKIGSRVKGYKVGQIQQFTPEMMDLYQQMFGHLGPESQTSRLAMGDQSTFDELEAPALKQFSGLQGNIASRFSGMGQGARKSSGFQNTMNQASTDFAQQLQSQRQGLSRQALNDLMGYSNALLQQKPYQTTATPKGQKWWQSLLTEFGSSAAKSAGESLGGNLFGGGGGGGGSPLASGGSGGSAGGNAANLAAFLA